jgi:hypothetical protein
VFLKGAAVSRAGRAKKGRAKKEWRFYGLLKNSILVARAFSAAIKPLCSDGL